MAKQTKTKTYGRQGKRSKRLRAMYNKGGAAEWQGQRTSRKRIVNKLKGK